MITLQKAGLEDAKAIHAMQVRAFQSLLDKYQDYGTNPAAEPIEKVLARMRMENSYYYFILLGNVAVGAIRIVDNGMGCRVSPIFILPEYQGHGYAQQAMMQAESLYAQALHWELSTIQEEPMLCHLYEKLGYRRTGTATLIQPGMTIVGYEKYRNGKEENNGNL